MPDIDSRNHFYLGREHDLATGETAPEPLLYKSKDLTTHAVCVGMTGSGKTGLCLSLLEEAALDGVPAICIDPKGDLGNLLLGFPDLDAKSFRPWVDESVAARKGDSPEVFAEKTAELWKNGLASWDQGPERIQKYNDSVERLIFTPGASHGIPMTVLKSFDAPPKALVKDADAFRERVQSAVSGLLALLGIDADPVRSREHIFLSTVLKTSWEKGKDLSIKEMIGEIQSPPFDSVGVMDLDTFYPEKDRTKLAMDLNNLLASPSFAGWMEGQPLNVDQLYYAPPDEKGFRKPRLSIISIAHLDDSQRMFFVTILLNEILAWMRTQPGTGSLRCLLYMDEVFGYFPPSANPPSKTPMLTLLKQARAFGLGCVLATQNPVDLDYKGLSNAGTWFLGRLQTERDKMRVMEGLEGASAQAGSTFDKQAMEKTLAGVGSRVFLMNNVHEDQPRVFHTRWAMSYLCGPLSRQQIEELMDPVRDKFLPPPEEEAASPEFTPASKPAELDPPIEDPPQDDTPKAVKRGRAPTEKQLQDARRELDSRKGELVWSIIGLPMLAVEPIYRVVLLLIAKSEKRATKRKTSSVFAAAGRSTSKLTKLRKAWSKWREAAVENQDLIARQTGEPAGSPPWLPGTAWIAVLVHGFLLFCLLSLLAGVLFSFGPTIQQAITGQPNPANGLQQESLGAPGGAPVEQESADRINE